jgi:hypothetical protein
LTNHESSDILQEHEWNVSFSTHLDKMSSLLCALRKQDSVIGNNTNWMAIEMPVSSD